LAKRSFSAIADWHGKRIPRRYRLGGDESAHLQPDGDGKPSIEEIPAALADEAKEAHEKLVEMIAEGDDEMMEEFFREGTIPIHDLIPAVRKAIVAEKIFPVLMTSSAHNIARPAC